MNVQILASGSSGNCYKVSDGQTSLLLECGIPFREIQKKLNFKLYEIDGCLVSHEHGDHSKAIMELLKSGIDVYMSKGTAAPFQHDFFKTIQIKAREQFQVGTFDILPFDTQHDAAEPLGFILYSRVTKEKLLFATDTYYIKYRFEGLNYIMVECNYAIDILRANSEAGRLTLALKNRLLQSHFELSNVKKFLEVNDLSRVKGIYLLHLSDGNSDEERFRREIQELTGKPVIIA
jgi:phosphoribosyl 1,2-cyclic phosphodiesterase